jgi:hypothetical protein
VVVIEEEFVLDVPTDDAQPGAARDPGKPSGRR